MKRMLLIAALVLNICCARALLAQCSTGACSTQHSAASAAGYRTANFVVNSGNAQFDRQVGDAAERYRRELAIAWLGHELPGRWSQPCPIRVSIGGGAGGATTFSFAGGHVGGWHMTMQGSPERILDSVLPHEVTHTIFASHFRQSLPRWADEGACTTVEHASERGKQNQMLIEFLRTGRALPMSRLFALTEYPPDVLPLYAQGHSIVRFLIEQRGRRDFVRFLEAGLASRDWPGALRSTYAIESLTDLQDTWLTWVRAGSPAAPALDTAGNTRLVAYGESAIKYRWTGGSGYQPCEGGNCDAPPLATMQPVARNPPVADSVPTAPVAVTPSTAAKGCECTGEGRCQCDQASVLALVTDLQRANEKLAAVVDELAQRECPPGATGPAGPPGPAGKPGQPCEINLDQLEEQIAKRLAGKLRVQVERIESQRK